MIPGVRLPNSQVPFLNPKTGLVSRDWYKFFESQIEYFGTMANQDADAVAITGGAISGVTIDNSVIGATTPAAATFTTLAIASGAILPSTYTPTTFATTNVDASSASVFQVARIGSTVMGSGRLTIDPTAGGGTATEVGFSIPYASAFADVGQLSGVGASGSNDVGRVSADTGNARGRINFDAGFAGARLFSVFFFYMIV